MIIKNTYIIMLYSRLEPHMPKQSRPVSLSRLAGMQITIVCLNGIVINKMMCPTILLDFMTSFHTDTHTIVSAGNVEKNQNIQRDPHTTTSDQYYLSSRLMHSHESYVCLCARHDSDGISILSSGSYL